MKVTREFDGTVFTFRIGDQELQIPLAGHANGAEIKKKALEWARQIDPSATI